MKADIEGAVSSSEASTQKMKALGIPVYDLNSVDKLSVYVDGADEINGHMDMISRRRGINPRENRCSCG